MREITQWEYDVMAVNTPQPGDDVSALVRLQHPLNKAGARGWEVVGVIPGNRISTLILKREKQPMRPVEDAYCDARDIFEM